MSLGLLAIGEEARGLNDNLNAELAPGQIGGVTLCEHLDVLAVDDDALVIVGHLTLEATRDRVVLQQVSKGLVVGQVVNGDDLDVRALLESGAEEVTADAAEAVDANAGGHYGSSCSCPSQGTVFDATGRAGCQPGPQISAVPAVPNLHPKADSVTIQFRNLHVG